MKAVTIRMDGGSRVAPKWPCHERARTAIVDPGLSLIGAQEPQTPSVRERLTIPLRCCHLRIIGYRCTSD